MIIADIAAAFLIGALSGMGIGGGGLLVIYLTLVRGADQLGAQGVNLYFFIFASASALFYHSVKRKINFPAVLLCSSVGMLFAFAGSYTATLCDPGIIRRLFGAMLIIAGAAVLKRNFFATGKKPENNME